VKEQGEFTSYLGERAIKEVIGTYWAQLSHLSYNLVFSIDVVKEQG